MASMVLSCRVPFAASVGRQSRRRIAQLFAQLAAWISGFPAFELPSWEAMGEPKPKVANVVI